MYAATFLMSDAPCRSLRAGRWNGRNVSATLYHLNYQRLEHWQPELPLVQQGATLQLRHQALAEALEDVHAEALQLAAPEAKEATELNAAKPDQTTLSKGARNHWEGLRLFLDHPEVPMDNNSTENAMRGPVNGRKDYHGSGSLWSAALAATLFTLFQTYARSNCNWCKTNPTPVYGTNTSSVTIPSAKLRDAAYSALQASRASQSRISGSTHWHKTFENNSTGN